MEYNKLAAWCSQIYLQLMSKTWCRASQNTAFQWRKEMLAKTMMYVDLFTMEEDTRQVHRQRRSLHSMMDQASLFRAKRVKLAE